MDRYRFQVSVYHPCDHEVRDTVCTVVTADDPVQARRQVLERAWWQGLMVESFISVERRPIV